MAQSKIIEGTGEELQDYLKQAPKERFRLISLPALEDSEPSDDIPANLEDTLKKYIGSSEYGEGNLSENTGKRFAELLAAKKQKT